MIRLLLKKGADVAVVNRQGFTPVRMAIANANALAVDALGGRASMVPMDDARLFNGSEHGEGCECRPTTAAITSMPCPLSVIALLSACSRVLSLTCSFSPSPCFLRIFNLRNSA